MIRQIIRIDEEKCNGCGLCAQACHESAIAMVDGKARLIRDDYCDGMGDCLPQCPTGAISFEEREAAAYDKEAVEANMKKKKLGRKECRAGGTGSCSSYGRLPGSGFQADQENCRSRCSAERFREFPEWLRSLAERFRGVLDWLCGFTGSPGISTGELAVQIKLAPVQARTLTERSF